jgi:hypothetical protein
MSSGFTDEQVLDLRGLKSHVTIVSKVIEPDHFIATTGNA